MIRFVHPIIHVAVEEIVALLACDLSVMQKFGVELESRSGLTIWGTC